MGLYSPEALSRYWLLAIPSRDACKTINTYEDYETSSQTSLQTLYHYTKIVDGYDVGLTPLFYYRKDQEPPVSLTGNEFIKIMKQCDDVIVWVSLGFNEQLLLAFLVRLFTRYSLPLEKIKVRKIETYLYNGKPEDIFNIGMVPPEGLKEAPVPTPLQQVEIDLLIQGWDAITSPTPEKMEAYLSLPPTTHFQKGLKDFQNRFPSSKTGLNRCQTELLEAYPLDQSSVSANFLWCTVIGKGRDKGRFDGVHDGYVIWHLMQMTNVYASRPAFMMTNPYTREHQISLTDYGCALLDGKANWMDENAVDYYVGGIHVKNNISKT